MKSYPRTLLLYLLLMVVVFLNACNKAANFETVEPTPEPQESAIPDDGPATQTAPIKQPGESPEIGDVYTPSAEEEQSINGSSYWVEVEDPHYGIRFAVPCFWSVDIPEVDRPGGIAYPIRNYTEEFVCYFGKNQQGVWDSGGLKIDMNFIVGDGLGVFDIQPGAGLLEFATRLYDSNPEVDLLSTEGITINGQESLLVTTETMYGISQDYLFQLSEDIYLMFSPGPGAMQNPDVQTILHSMALNPGVEVDIPEIVPWNPPLGITAPCLEPFYDYCLSVDEPDILEQNAVGMTDVEIAGTLFGQYLEQYQVSIMPASCKLRSYRVEDVSIDPALDFFVEEQGVDMMAWVTYSVQAAAPGFWLAGNGVSGEDGWVLDKSMIVGLTRIGDVFKLTIHGTGP